MIGQPIIDFFASQAGVELLRIIDSGTTIIAAILSGAALRNTSQVKNAIGGVLRKPLRQAVRDIFRRRSKAERFASATLSEQPSTLVERLDRVEGLKNTYERAWVLQGIRNTEVEKRLDRVDPPRRKAMNTDD